ncbi:MAG: FAD-dependent oxidoreductase [Gemmatimonadaceae bacterium]|nr:FAD-dependent oxidoreductase [Gemmatimonadaceae bacterium]
MYDVVVYGDSSGAVIAAIAAEREGRSVILVNPTRFPGGMSSSGLGATDFLGKRNTFGGIASEFYDAVAAAYGTNYVRSFEPHVGRQVFEKMIADAEVTVVYDKKLDHVAGQGVELNEQRIEAITTLSGKTYRGGCSSMRPMPAIDGRSGGDLHRWSRTGESIRREPRRRRAAGRHASPRLHYPPGRQGSFHQGSRFLRQARRSRPADSCRISSALTALANGQGDKKIQAYNYRVCLTTDCATPHSHREAGRLPARWITNWLLRNFDAGDHRLPALIEPLAGGKKKVDWNNMHAVGSDLPGANWDYPEASYDRRHEIEKEHEIYLRGFLMDHGEQSRVPEAIRKRTATYWAGPGTNAPTDGGWGLDSTIIREALADGGRLRGDATRLLTAHSAAPDPVGLGSFGFGTPMSCSISSQRSGQAPRTTA